jgi:hypothetical protein
VAVAVVEITAQRYTESAESVVEVEVETHLPMESQELPTLVAVVVADHGTAQEHLVVPVDLV